MKVLPAAALLCVTVFLSQTATPKTSQTKGWLVYRPDLDVSLPDTTETNGPISIYIARSFKGADEDALLRKAEAVYPQGTAEASRPKIHGDSSFPLCKQDHMTGVPKWGERGNDNIEMTNVVTASAVRYYYDLSLLARKDPHLPSGFTALQTSMKYEAGIKFFSSYSHGKDAWHNIYVANLTLTWSFHCGGLCGVGFTRNKVVVLNAQGEVVALYLDDPVNRESWVS